MIPFVEGPVHLINLEMAKQKKWSKNTDLRNAFGRRQAMAPKCQPIQVLCMRRALLAFSGYLRLSEFQQFQHNRAQVTQIDIHSANHPVIHRYKSLQFCNTGNLHTEA